MTHSVAHVLGRVEDVQNTNTNDQPTICIEYSSSIFELNLKDLGFKARGCGMRAASNGNTGRVARNCYIIRRPSASALECIIN